MSRRRSPHRIPMGLSGPGIPAQHGYTAEVRAKISVAQLGKPHPQRNVYCQCGKACPAGPMKRHTNATGHLSSRRPLDDQVSTIQ
jgi:hypothetical protein